MSHEHTHAETDRGDSHHSAPMIAGVTVREDDVEAAKGIRFIAFLFRGMAILMIVLMCVQIISGVTGTVALSLGVLFAEAVRLIIFAGLLWGLGDIAVLAIKSHYDLRAMKILVARAEYLMRMQAAAAGTLPPPGTRADRES
ncbi:MAG: hypothetical protein JWM95_4738 [Gemmatimonadetes bacterium]|nr:hypothetical protein [Gemmatimonadota bacterium]